MLEEKVLEASTRVLGPEHPDTLTSMDNLAYTYSKLGCYQDAIALEKRVLEANTRITSYKQADTPGRIVAPDVERN